MSYKGKRVLAHRMIMEFHLGRPLASNEIVHHINGDPLDNRLENLEVMEWGKHTALHRQKFVQCKICGMTKEQLEHKPATEDLCNRCWQRIKRRSRSGMKVDGPNRKDLSDHWGKSLIDGQWVAFDACTHCGKTDKPHMTRGLCRRCRERERWHNRIKT